MEPKKLTLIDLVPGYQGTLLDYIRDPDVKHDDKISVARKLLSKNLIVKFQIACCKSVMVKFKRLFSNDNRIFNAISFLESIQDFDDLTKKETAALETHLYNCRESRKKAHIDSHSAYIADAVIAALSSALFLTFDCSSSYSVLAVNNNAQDLQRRLNEMVLAKLIEDAEVTNGLHEQINDLLIENESQVSCTKDHNNQTN